MTRAIRFNAFDMNCVGHQSPGLSAHPCDKSWKYRGLDYWQDLARTLGRGVLDGIFVADVIEAVKRREADAAITALKSAKA